jgi:hypothetical protein
MTRTTRAAFSALALSATMLCASSAFAQSSPGAPPAGTSLSTPGTKRCQAAQRRVERQKQVVLDLEARRAKDAQARERCDSKRSCARLDRNLHAHDARRTRYERQLAQYEADARRICLDG